MNNDKSETEMNINISVSNGSEKFWKQCDFR